MMTENDTILIQALTDSYRVQLAYYCKLRDVVRQIMSRLVLSRGALSMLTDGLRDKQKLMEAIEDERARIADYVVEWQNRKATVVRCPATEILDAVLQQITDAIQEFLNDEAQLQKYLEGIIARTMHP